VATMLSDFGADVIKVEPPGLGDPHRLLSSVPPSPAAPGNYSWHLPIATSAACPST
jgi:crotonobetainyl-CoA:carnitine CoA-transferase CaiB-like acyl-CoA transferase